MSDCASSSRCACPSRVLDALEAWQGAHARARRPGRPARAPARHARLPRLTGPPASSRRSSARCGRPRRTAPADLRLAPVRLPGDAERRDARPRRPRRRARRALAARRPGPPGARSGSTGARAGPGCRTSPWPASGSVRGSGPTRRPDANVCSVRRGCLSITTASAAGRSTRTGIGWLRRLRVDKHEALDVALGQIERQFGKGSVMKMNDRAAVAIGSISTGSLALDLALGVGGLPRGRIVEVFGPESSGKTTLVYHVIAEAQRRGGICAFIDAEHAMDPGVREADRRRHRQPPRLAAGHRRAGARDRRAAHPLGRARRRRDRLGRRAHAEGRDRGRDGRLARRPAGAAHVAGAAQARRHAQPHRHDLPLHEPAAREDRRHVRQPGDDARRARAEVLRVDPPRHPPHRDAEGRRRGDRQPHPRQGREEQGRAAVQAGRVRHHVRHRLLLGRHGASTSASSARSSRSRARTSASATSGSARAARTRPRSCRSIPTSRSRSSSRSSSQVGPEQVVSARLLPLVEEAERRTARRAARRRRPRLQRLRSRRSARRPRSE